MARRKKGQDIHGFVNFYKPKGMSSNAAVGYVRRLFDAKKAGHGGTLDPLAEGVLPIALGEATKTLSYMLAEDKHYQFEMTFGAERDTDDAEGEVVQVSDNRPSQEELLDVMANFQGEISQMPPVYSALKVNGKRACDRVRAGETVELAPRDVTIFNIELESFDTDKATLNVHVSKGTYVRSLCRDIGRALGCFAFVSVLVRTKVPPFLISQAVTQEKLDLCTKMGQSAQTYLLDVDYVLDDIPVYTISKDEAQTVLNGQALELKGDHGLSTGQMVRLKTKCGLLVSLAMLDNAVAKPQKNFPLLFEK